MADRYWVGGSGSWSSTAKWSTTSNGTSGASVPTAADNAIFDASSDSGEAITITLTGASTCLNLTMSAIDQNLTFTGAFTLSVVGNISLSATKTIDVTGITALSMTGTTTRTITSSGGTLTGGILFNGVGGTFTLQDALTLSGTATLTNGTLALDSYTFSCDTFSSSNANARTISFGTGKIVVTSAATATVWTTTTITNLTISGTPLVQLTGAGATTKTISAGALSEANAISFQISNTAGTVTFTASNTVKNLTIANNSFTLSNVAITIYGNLIVDGTSPTLTAGGNAWTFAATSGTKTITTNGETLDFPITFNGVGGTFRLDGDLTVGTSTGRNFSVTNGTFDLYGYNLILFGVFQPGGGTTLNNTGGTTNAITLNLNTTTTVWNGGNLTGFTNDGNINVKINGDNGATTKTIAHGSTAGTEARSVSFEVTSNFAGTVSIGSAYIKNLTFANASYTVSNAFNNIYGNLTIGGTTPTFTAGASQWSFTATSGTKTITTNGKTLDFPIAFNGVGGTWQLQDNLAVGTATSRTVTLTNGTLDLNEFTFTIFGQFSSSNSNARTIAFGTTGKIVLSATGAIATTLCTMTTETNLTVTGTNPLFQVTGSGVGPLTVTSTSTLINLQLSPVAAATIAVTGNIKNFTIDNSSNITLSNGTRSIYGNLTIGGISPTLTAGASATTFAATSGTQTITTNGAVIDFPITFNGVGGTWQLQDALVIGTSTSRTVTLTNGTLDLNSYTMTIFGIFSSSNTNTRRIQMSGSGGKIVLSLNTATTVWSTPTVTNMTTDGNILVQLTGGGAVVKTISAGALSEANSISFQLSNTAGTATFTASNTVKNLTIDNNSFTVSNIALTIYGNLLIGGTTVTLTAGTIIWTFSATSGTKTITTNGATLVFPLTFNGVGGTWALQDALTMNSSRVITLTNGTFNLNNYTCTAAGGFTVTGSGSKVLAHGTGDLVISLAGATAFNGSDLGITDGSAAPVTITNNGTAVYDDDTPFVGASSSILFNGTSQYLSVIANNAFLFDAGNFTIEAWIRPTSVATGPGISNTWQIGGAWHFSLSTSGYLKFSFTNAAAGVSTVGFTGTTRQVTANSWNHVAVVRNGNTITFYVNGVADATTFNATGMTMYYYDGAAKALKIGVGADTAGYFPGQISNFRIVKGTAVYTANFTPSTSPLTAVSGTSILVQQNHISVGTLTSTGTGKIDMTSATAKTFSGGNNSYATLNQGGAGTLTIRGTNTFQNITNSVQPANVSFTANTTQTFTNDFNLNGTSGNLITIGSVTPASTFTLSKSSGTVDVSFCSISDSIATGGAAWYAGTTSTNGGNNTGWLFTAIVLATGSFLLLF